MVPRERTTGGAPDLQPGLYVDNLRPRSVGTTSLHRRPRTQPGADPPIAAPDAGLLGRRDRAEMVRPAGRRFRIRRVRPVEITSVQAGRPVLKTPVEYLRRAARSTHEPALQRLMPVTQALQWFSVA